MFCNLAGDSSFILLDLVLGDKEKYLHGKRNHKCPLLSPDGTQNSKTNIYAP